MKYKNIITNDMGHCMECGHYIVEIHHVFYGSKRNKSTEDGLVVPLCAEHHRGTYGVHGREGHDLDLKYKKLAEQKYLEFYNKNVEDFIERYGKNYL